MQHEQLILWIAQARKAGLSEADIRQQLFAIGWASEEITAALVGQSASHTMPPTSGVGVHTSLRPKTLLVVFVCIFIVVGICAAYIYYKDGSRSKVVIQPAKNTNVSILTLHSEDDYIGALVDVQCFLYQRGQTGPQITNRILSNQDITYTNSQEQERETSRESISKEHGFSSFNELLLYMQALTREQIAATNIQIKELASARGCGST